MDSFRKIDGAAVNRGSDDGTLGAQVGEPTQVVQLADAARGNDVSIPEGYPVLDHDGDGVEVGLRECAVASDIGEDEATDADLVHVGHEVDGIDVGGFCPPADGDLAVVCIEANDDAIGTVLLYSLFHHVGVGDGGGAEDDATDACIEGRGHVVFGAEPPAYLKRNAETTGKGAVELALLGATFEGAVEVDDVDSDGTGVDEPLGDLERIVGEGALPVEVALAETNDLALAEVDCWDNFHSLLLHAREHEALHEIVVELESDVATLLGVKLGGDEVVAGNDAGELQAIGGGACDPGVL